MSDRHVRGPTRARKHARLETRHGGPGESGRGYERIRTQERVESDPRDTAVDVEMLHHRLLAVAWDIDDCLPAADASGLIDPALLDGLDVHHDASDDIPDSDAERGVEWDSREAVLNVIDHGRHSGLTNTAKRAYAEDAKRVRDGDVTLPTGGGCVECGEEAAARVAGERYCLDHATAVARGTDEAVEVL